MLSYQYAAETKTRDELNSFDVTRAYSPTRSNDHRILLQMHSEF